MRSGGVLGWLLNLAAAIPLRIAWGIGIALLVPVFSDDAARKLLPNATCSGDPCSLTELRIGLVFGACICIGVVAYIRLVFRRVGDAVGEEPDRERTEQRRRIPD